MSLHRSFLTGFPASPNLWGCKEKPKHQTYVSFGLCCAVQRPTPPSLVAPRSHASLFPFWFLPCHPHTCPSSSHMSIPSFCCVHTFQVPFPECFYCIGKDKISLSCRGDFSNSWWKDLSLHQSQAQRVQKKGWFPRQLVLIENVICKALC